MWRGRIIGWRMMQLWRESDRWRKVVRGEEMRGLVEGGCWASIGLVLTLLEKSEYEYN